MAIPWTRLPSDGHSTSPIASAFRRGLEHGLEHDPRHGALPVFSQVVLPNALLVP